MIFSETKLRNAWRIGVERLSDGRGFLTRTMCAHEFAARGILRSFVQTNIALNFFAGTIRGLHFQRYPHAGSRLIRCTRGAIFDVIVDLRPESPTYLEWQGFELTADSGDMLFVPEAFAHGYQTLRDETEVTDQVSAYFVPEAEGGLRWNDPRFAINWPHTVTTISERDAVWPLLQSKPMRDRTGKLTSKGEGGFRDESDSYPVM